MKKSFLFLMITIVALMFSCSKPELKESYASSLLKERTQKEGGRSVSFYLGSVTDPTYRAVYKKISTGKYLEYKENVYVKAAGKSFPLFSATKLGKDIFKCKNNRCTAEVCRREFGKIESIKVFGSKNAEVKYRVNAVCDSELYNVFKPLADKQYISSKKEELLATFVFDKDKWVLQ